MATRGQKHKALTRAPTGIPGLDSLTAGGLPAQSVTAIIGSAGSGKTVLALHILATVARERGEAGIFVAFEEPADKLIRNAESFGWGLPQLMRRSLVFVDARLPDEAVQAGTFEISGLLASVAARARAMKARWVVFDAIDVLLDLLPDVTMRRREIRRLKTWMQKSGLTCIVPTKTEAASPREVPAHVYLAYMVECVIRLERRREGDLTTRWMAIEKYRGSMHAEAWVPYLIGAQGIEVALLRAYTDGYKVYRERISTGVERLDSMLGGGLLRGSSTLVTGAPGTSKTTLAGRLAETACGRGEHVLYVCFDESGEEIVRNLGSVGTHLASYVRDGVLQLLGMSSRARSIESQWAEIIREIEQHNPRVVVIDPLSALLRNSSEGASVDAGYRLVQECKLRGISLFATSLTGNALPETEISETHISTLADTWIHLTYLVRAGERNRALTIVKSRGSGHSNQVRELVLSDKGVTLTDVFVDEGEVLMGTLRYQREAAAGRQQRLAQETRGRARRQKEYAVKDLTARISQQQSELEQLRGELALDAVQDRATAGERVSRRVRISSLRRADTPPSKRKR